MTMGSYLVTQNPLPLDLYDPHFSRQVEVTLLTPLLMVY